MNQKYGIPKSPQKDGYFYKSIKSSDGRRRMIKAESRRELKSKINAIEESTMPTPAEPQNTFLEMFDAVQERKLSLTKDAERLLSVKNSVKRRRQMYARYFSGTDFEKMPVKSIKAKHIEDIYEYNLQRYDLRRKATADMRSVLKTTFDLALRRGIIRNNPYPACDFEQYCYLVVPDSKVSERGYSQAEIDSIIELLHAQQCHKSKYYVSYALELQILCGLRRGEVPPLRWSDIHDGCIDICREQVTTKDGCVIVGHTKTWTDRRFPVTEKVMDLLKRLKVAQYNADYHGIYLFPHGDGCISNRAVYHLHERICDKLGITISKDCVRGTHAFRRNAITDVANKPGGGLLIASKLFGNTPTVAEKNYFTGIDLESAVKLLDS